MKAAVCCYPTGIHDGKLGRGVADTINRFEELSAQVLMIFGTLDPHVPSTGREKIFQAFSQANIQPDIRLYEANHTFMRDDGYRFDPVATDAAWSVITTFLQQHFE